MADGDVLATTWNEGCIKARTIITLPKRDRVALGLQEQYERLRAIRKMAKAK